MYLLERIFALRALIAAAMASGYESVRALRAGANFEGESARVVVWRVSKAWFVSSTAGVVAEAEPLGERCRLPRVLQGWVGLRSECPALRHRRECGHVRCWMPVYG